MIFNKEIITNLFLNQQIYFFCAVEIKYFLFDFFVLVKECSVKIEITYSQYLTLVDQSDCRYFVPLTMDTHRQIIPSKRNQIYVESMNTKTFKVLLNELKKLCCSFPYKTLLNTTQSKADVNSLKIRSTKWTYHK